jgi:hypothetical protein
MVPALTVRIGTILLAPPVASVRPANRIKEVAQRLNAYDLPGVAQLAERAAKLSPPIPVQL